MITDNDAIASTPTGLKFHMFTLYKQHEQKLVSKIDAVYKWLSTKETITKKSTSGWTQDIDLEKWSMLHTWPNHPLVYINTFI